jgi:assimilatory nitrate reductase catalytic subunit
VQLENSRGKALVRAQVTGRQRKGALFAPMHWTGNFSSEGRINALVHPLTDPVSGQPGLKTSPVNVSPVRVALYGFAVSRHRPNCNVSHYWATARAEGGWRTELAFFDSPGDAGALVAALFGPQAGFELLSFNDPSAGRTAFAGFAGPRLVLALWLSPAPVLASRQWAVAQLAGQHHHAMQRSAILSGRAGANRPDPGPLVCSCFGVGANQIATCAASGQATTVDAVGAVLKAGTNCGSCRIEIERILDAHRLQRAV